MNNYSIIQEKMALTFYASATFQKHEVEKTSDMSIRESNLSREEALPDCWDRRLPLRTVQIFHQPILGAKLHRSIGENVMFKNGICHNACANMRKHTPDIFSIKGFNQPLCRKGQEWWWYR